MYDILTLVKIKIENLVEQYAELSVQGVRAIDGAALSSRPSTSVAGIQLLLRVQAMSKSRRRRRAAQGRSGGFTGIHLPCHRAPTAIGTPRRSELQCALPSFWGGRGCTYSLLPRNDPTGYEGKLSQRPGQILQLRCVCMAMLVPVKFLLSSAAELRRPPQSNCTVATTRFFFNLT